MATFEDRSSQSPSFFQPAVRFTDQRAATVIYISTIVSILLAGWLLR